MPTRTEKLQAIQQNIYPGAHLAVENWERFPWHLHAQSPKSSQALAIDVFGTLQVAPQPVRDKVCEQIATLAELPAAGPWTLALEWEDEHRLLAEPRPTQVDVVAQSPQAILLFECKFTEAGGGCSQTSSKAKSPAACNGAYEYQTNPQNGIQDRCALSGKGIRYWNWIEDVYGLSSDADHVPCPFASDAYQWMRNTVLAAALREHTGMATRVIATYADGKNLQTAEKARYGRLGLKTQRDRDAILPLSYQAVLAIAQTTDPEGPWTELSQWVEAKINRYAGRAT